ncbi:MAG: DUF1361 domain-containing protein [Bacteroidetes bacterium]|nr:DUF1361 domain-containing protein [Bacteroidota bacterium]
MKTNIRFQNVLFAFFALIAIMMAIRFIYTGGQGFVFLVWNLFLAWIPYVISSKFSVLIAAPPWQQFTALICWFVFYPNALYIVTDLIHLDLDTIVPKWFDAILLFTASIAGLLMGFVSLLRLEFYLSFKMKPQFVHVVMIAVLFFGSFGVYLGRFLRWNSWDVLQNPLHLFGTIAVRIINPVIYWQTWGITVLLTALFYLLFVSIKAIKVDL